MIDSTASVVEDRTKANVEVVVAVAAAQLTKEVEKEVSEEKDERVKACLN